MRSVLTGLASLALLACLLAPARADVGLVASFDDAMAPLARQMRAGAEIAADAGGTRLHVADDLCSALGGEAAAREMIAARARVVVGFLCTEAIEAAMPVLAAARIPVITTGVRTDSLTDRRMRTGWPVFRLAPRADAERAAVAEIMPRLWRNALFAIVDDGTIYGRELAETLRFAAEAARLQPVFVDTFRPQLDNQIGLVGRLRRAGATHVFVGGDREDVAIMSRDAQGLDYDLTVAGGEALRGFVGEVQLAEGTLMVGLPEWADETLPEVLRRFEARGIRPEGYAVPTHAAVEIALAAIARADAEQRAVRDVLAEDTFDTALGPIRFDDAGDLAESPYRLFRFDGLEFRPVADAERE